MGIIRWELLDDNGNPTGTSSSFTYYTEAERIAAGDPPLGIDGMQGTVNFVGERILKAVDPELFS